MSDFCSNWRFLFARQLARAFDQIVLPLENFRKEQIGGVKVSLHLLPSNYF
jgi:hypothetical protein